MRLEKLALGRGHLTQNVGVGSFGRMTDSSGAFGICVASPQGQSFLRNLFPAKTRKGRAGHFFTTKSEEWLIPALPAHILVAGKAGARDLRL